VNNELVNSCEKLIIASNNEHKVKELKQLLKPYFSEIISLKEAGCDIVPDETGEMFYDNALIKAKTVSDILKVPVLADDSGLCVDALDGLPGVHSARYALTQNVGNIDDANNDKLLQELKGIEDRIAYFESVVLIYFPDNKIIFGEGRVHGRILYEKKGSGGFGYDCLFYSDELHKTFAEASAEEKNAISHRARAVKALIGKL